MSASRSSGRRTDQESFNQSLLGFDFFRAAVRGLKYRIEREIAGAGPSWRSDPAARGKILSLTQLPEEAEAAEPRIEAELIAAGIEQGRIVKH